MGFVACRVRSKILGIGSAEKAWADVKNIKMGKRSHLSAESTEKRSILYTTAKVNDARIKRKLWEKVDTEGHNAAFGDNDMK